MASVRERYWRHGGKTKRAWVVSFENHEGKRSIKTFPTRESADWFCDKISDVEATRETVEVLTKAGFTLADLPDDRFDLLFGVPAIGRFTSLNPVQVADLITNHALPSFRIGAVTCARKSSLRTWLHNVEEAAHGERREA